MVYWLAFLLFISSNAVSYGYEDIEDEIDRYKRQEINGKIFILFDMNVYCYAILAIDIRVQPKKFECDFCGSNLIQLCLKLTSCHLHM